MGKHYKNTLRRAKLIQELAAKYYEPGNYSKSYHQVWRNHVNQVYPMSYHTYLKYLNMDTSSVPSLPNHKQLKLF